MSTQQTLEAALVISAVDKNTQRVIEQIGARLDKLAATGKHIDGIGDHFDRLGRHLDGVSERLDKLHTHMGRIDRMGTRMSKSLGPVARVTSAIAAGAISSHVAIEGVKATAEGAHERVRMDVAGMTPGEIREAEEISARLTGQYRSVSQTTMLHLLRNARSIVGNYDEAAHIIEPLLKTYVVAQGAHPERSEELAEDFDKLVKGMEIKGVTQDLPKFERYLNGMSKALNVFGDTLRPTDYYEMFKYGRQATQGFNEKFMLMTAPTLAQELGGSGAGKALSSFYQAIVGGRMKMAAIKELERFGLLDKKKVLKTSTGATKGLLPGGVVGAKLAAEDPYAWVNQVLLPALAKKKVTDPQKIQEILAVIFQAGTAAQMAAIFATQQSRIEKDWRLVEGAKGSEAAYDFQAKDPFVAWRGVTSQFQNFLQVAGGPLAEPAARGLNAIAAGLHKLSEETAKHPLIGGAATVTAGAAGVSAAAAAAGSFFGWSWLKSLGMGGLRFVPAVGGAAWAASLLPEIERQRAAGGGDWEWAAGLHKDDWRKAEGGFFGDERLPDYGSDKPKIGVDSTVKIELNTPLFDAHVSQIVRDNKGRVLGTKGPLGISMGEVGQ